MNGQRVVLYARVSTDDQADHGVSLDAQLAQGRTYASLYGLEVVGEVVDPGASAKSLRRDGWARVAAILDEGQADGVVIAKLDRLTRSLRDLDTLLCRYFHDGQKGVSLHCIAERVDTSTASGRLVLHVLMSVAQWEREIIGERTSAALQHKRARGERVGQVPFGYTVAPDGVELVEDPDEQEVIARVRELRDLGVSIRKIAERLNLEGAPARGCRWHPTTVARLLKREAA